MTDARDKRSLDEPRPRKGFDWKGFWHDFDWLFAWLDWLFWWI